MWDFTEYETKDLIVIRKAYNILRSYGLDNEEALEEVCAELNRR